MNIEIGQWNVVVSSTVTRAPEGYPAHVFVERDSVEGLMPVLHEVHKPHFGDLIACIHEPFNNSVRIDFTETEMDSEKMQTIVRQLFVQAIDLHQQRAIARSKPKHPSSNPRASKKAAKPRYVNSPQVSS